MSSTDVDPQLLRDLTAAASHAGEMAIVHNAAEVVGSVPGLMETLAGDRFAYMLMPDFQPDGSIRLPIQTTRDEVAATYEVVRGRSDVLSEEPVIELRTPWYAFWESVSTGQLKGTTEQRQHPLAVISPVGTADGITGEIIWPLLPWSLLGTGDDTVSEKDAQTMRRELRLQHMRHVEALAANDAAAIAAEVDGGAAAAVRDYVDDTDALVELVGPEAHRAHYEALFARYQFDAVELVHRITQPWYLFAELRLTVRERGAGGATLAFHTCQIHAPGKSGLTIATIGWGTDPAPV